MELVFEPCLYDSLYVSTFNPKNYKSELQYIDARQQNSRLADGVTIATSCCALSTKLSIFYIITHYTYAITTMSQKNFF